MQMSPSLTTTQDRGTYSVDDASEPPHTTQDRGTHSVDYANEPLPHLHPR